ncbi:MAG: acyl-CoA dehydrogenase [Parahaliea sp.]
MADYRAPLDDMTFLIDELLDAGGRLGALPQYEEFGVGPELTAALLGEAGKLAGGVISPLRRAGDTQPARCNDGKVSITPGYDEALRQLGEGGWHGIAADQAYGGQGLPEIYSTAAFEMWNSADMALALEPMLSIGAAMALQSHASEEQKQTYLPRMNSGEWAGTMNLTESGAGSDLGVMKTRAEPEGDHYRIYGQKIFITWGDHEVCDNIIHLVLAKLPDAPEGSRGISLFIVPKYLVNADGSLGERNDVYPVSVEHKLGIHGSPTCVMAFGDKAGAIGYLVGEANHGLAYMFTMMNEARLKVGIQGLGMSESAYQLAVDYARERVQGGVPIIEHPDVKRMLMTMRAQNEAMRALVFSTALHMDLAHAGPQEDRPAEQARVDLMIPVIKGWLTEVGQEVTSLGVQVHGGMGYIEETGAAQFLRDVRIAAIYEGTNGIQAADLVGRKLGRDGGAAMEVVLAEVAQTVQELRQAESRSLDVIGAALGRGLDQMRASTKVVLDAWAEDKNVALAASFDYMMQAGYLFGGWQLAKAALLSRQRISEDADKPFYRCKMATAVYYAEQILPRCGAHAGAVANAGGTLQSYSLDWL